MGTARQATCVALGSRGVLIAGAPGSGKSALALALIDRGAKLVGDDGVLVEAAEGKLIARPHPRTRGLLEVRNLGLLTFLVDDMARIALLVVLDPQAPRFIDTPGAAEIGGIAIPEVRLWPGDGVLPLKVELALGRYGLPE